MNILFSMCTCTGLCLRHGRILNLYAHTVAVDGTLVAGAFSANTLLEIHAWLSASVEFTDIVDRLHPRIIPTGYNNHIWKQGEFVSPVYKIFHKVVS